jgi:hypothetical protein
LTVTLSPANEKRRRGERTAAIEGNARALSPAVGTTIPRVAEWLVRHL